MCKKGAQENNYRAHSENLTDQHSASLSVNGLLYIVITDVYGAPGVVTATFVQWPILAAEIFEKICIIFVLIVDFLTPRLGEYSLSEVIMRCYGLLLGQEYWSDLESYVHI
jgi:hypothetical protein